MSKLVPLLSLGLVLSAGALSTVFASNATKKAAVLRVATAKGKEALPGFDRLLGTQLGAQFDGQAQVLAKGTGFPVLPGYHVTLTGDAMQLLDVKRVPLESGRSKDRRVAQGCVSGCPYAFWSAFDSLWLQSARSATRTGFVHPQRLLWAAASDVPAQTLLDAAYAAVESWTLAAPPELYLLFDAKEGGVRARQFRLMPPQGISNEGVDGALGLQVKLQGSEQFGVSAMDPAFQFAGSVTGKGALIRRLREIKRRYPSKRAFIVQVGQEAKMQDLAELLTATIELFPETVLDAG